MMRRHEHVARIGIGGDEPGQRRPLEVTREEQPSACRLHGEHEARLIVCRERILQRDLMNVWIAADGGRMQHADAAEWIERE